jgi:GTP-binding protein EngB required for normal cell division
MSSPLNPNQRHHIWASCQYVDRLLEDLESVPTVASSGSPFAKYVDDLTPAQKRVLRDYCASIRAQMVQAMQRHGIEPGSTPASSRHAIRTALGLVDIAIEEMRPQYMSGYGAMADEAVPELQGLANELQSLVRRLDLAMAPEAGADLRSRLAQLEEAGSPNALLSNLERVIERHGLVAFRPALEGILERYEDRRFEIAVFGRVSSGKSSLLNYLIGAAILPVGVTPVTAVPARLQRGAVDEFEVHFADRKAERLPLARLAEFVTEDGNPSNKKHVTRLRVSIASSRLPEHVVFVDTPGLGSLATDGTTETLAYLPRCDVGVVLLDASSAPTPDDIGTVRRLSEAGIPPMVVLSKADLLTPEELGRMRDYVAQHLQSDVGLAIVPHAISTRASHASLVDAWLADEIEPLVRDHRALVEASLQRKIGVLRLGVQGALRARVGHKSADAPVAIDPAPIEAELRRTAALFEDVRKVCEAQRDPPQLVLTEALDLAAERAGTALDYPHSMPGGPATAVRAAFAQVASDNADDVRRPLGVLIEKVRATLTSASRAAGVPESTAAADWNRLMREMPPFVIDEVNVELRVALRNVLGKGVAHARLRSAIAAQTGDRIERALRAHSLALHEWSLRVWSRVRDEFHAQAGVIRAQFDRSDGAPSSGSTTIEQDLAAL